MSNEDLKNYAKRNKVRQYQIAEYLGLSESKLSTMYRKPINEKMQRDIINAVNALSKKPDKQIQAVQAAPEEQAVQLVPAVEPIHPIQVLKAALAQDAADIFSNLSVPKPVIVDTVDKDAY